MNPEKINFNDGAAYDKYMGVWSQLVGDAFLRWLAPKPTLRWLDIGCGSGPFTEMIAENCAPVSVNGVDPSEPQLVFARTRPLLRHAHFQTGDAMALPFPDQKFDVAVMPLVLFFVPVPATGVAEMKRVVAPGGIVTAYAWDMPAGGFPYDRLNNEIRAMGVDVPQAPNPDASRLDVMQTLWTDAGLRDVETRVITVQRTFKDFDDFWAIILGGPNIGPRIKAMPPENIERLKQRMRTIPPFDSTGTITCSARAHAVKGCVPSPK